MISFRLVTTGQPGPPRAKIKEQTSFESQSLRLSRAVDTYAYKTGCILGFSNKSLMSIRAAKLNRTVMTYKSKQRCIPVNASAEVCGSLRIRSRVLDTWLGSPDAVVTVRAMFRVSAPGGGFKLHLVSTALGLAADDDANLAHRSLNKYPRRASKPSL